MIFSIELTSSAEKELRKLQNNTKNRVINSIKSLSGNPRPSHSKKLVDSPFYRIRIGNFRVIYRIYDRERIVIIMSIGHRKDVYKNR